MNDNNKTKVNLSKPNMYQRFKKHDIKVCLDFNKSEKDISQAKLKVYLDGVLSYSTRANVLEVREVESYKVNFKKFRSEPYTYHFIVWKSKKAKKSFEKWGTNFRVWNQISLSVSDCFNTMAKHI